MGKEMKLKERVILVDDDPTKAKGEDGQATLWDVLTQSQ